MHTENNVENHTEDKAIPLGKAAFTLYAAGLLAFGGLVGRAEYNKSHNLLKAFGESAVITTMVSPLVGSLAFAHWGLKNCSNNPEYDA